MSTENSAAKKLQDELYDWVQSIAVILSVVILLFTFFFRIIGVEGDSMNPTLKDNDWLVISNLFYEPEYGDIVVLTKNSFMSQPIVKRVIATEGQVIDIDFTTGTVTVDGKVLDEPYIADFTKRQLGMEFPQLVPNDCVFVLGDNRNHSSDSRDPALGMVHKQYILGRLIFRIFPLNKIGAVA
ncbi:MAG: signal peptidase I [Ruminococcaceae bacterium]|nr:signal peptidase I [Oscillospiraceae bacterium]